MPSNRIFTDRELNEMGTPTIDLLQDAIESDDKEKAKMLANRLQGEASIIHDSYLSWITSLLSFIGRHNGDEAVEASLREFWSEFMKPMAEIIESFDKEGDMRGKADFVGSGFRVHFKPVKIEEDDEKFVFEMQPCGSGQQLMIDKAYEPPYNFLKIKKPQPMTWGQGDFPVYCCHGPVMAMIGIETTGAPFFIEEPSDNIGEKNCKLYLYKDPRNIPEEFYAKVGKKKVIEDKGSD